MQCSQCGTPAGEDEIRVHEGKPYCDDCYLELMFRPKTCDPWAVHSAKSLERSGGSEKLPLTERQSLLLKVLKETGGMQPEALARKFDISLIELEREIAALRHMERVRAELREGVKYIRLW